MAERPLPSVAALTFVVTSTDTSECSILSSPSVLGYKALPKLTFQLQPPPILSQRTPTRVIEPSRVLSSSLVDFATTISTTVATPFGHSLSNSRLLILQEVE